MKKFMDKDFLLSTETSKKLYHNYAKDMPIIDYHCHVSPKEIYEDKRFKNITEVWLLADHYKWRIMRSNGVDEKYITGDASDREKFQKFAEALPNAIGNPMYHWCHLELKNYFGYDGVLNGDTAQDVWELTKEKLQNPDMGVRGLIEKSNVSFVGTTDEAIDSLEWHKKIAQDKTIKTVVAPSFRPDKVLNIEKDGWKEYLSKLADAVVDYSSKKDSTRCSESGKKERVIIDNIEKLEEAISDRIAYFYENGCKASDHGLDKMIYEECSKTEADNIMKKVLKDEVISDIEVEMFKTYLLKFCAKEYVKVGLVMQLHYNCMRNPNDDMFKVLGPDTGFDCIGPDNGAWKLAKLLNSLYKEGTLPKTIIYSLDSSDNSVIDTIIGAFQGKELNKNDKICEKENIAGKIQHGSAWWFNDNKQGMIDQLTSLANLSLLGNFVGMLTDSRSFLSYTRHEYFRRILCELIGMWVENGEYPDDDKTLEKLVKDICCENAKKYFELIKM